MKNSVLRTLFVLRTDPSAMFKIRIFDNFARFPDEICPKNNTETPAQTYSVLLVIKLKVEKKRIYKLLSVEISMYLANEFINKEYFPWFLEEVRS